MMQFDIKPQFGKRAGDRGAVGALCQTASTHKKIGGPLEKNKMKVRIKKKAFDTRQSSCFSNVLITAG